MRIHTILVIAILVLFITTHTQAEIVFISSRDGDRDVYSMQEDGSRVRKLTNDQYPEYHPVWSPDGEQIAFSRDIGADNERQQFDIFIMDSDGSNQRNLTKHSAEDYGPSWSPDGRRIAFSSNRTGRDEVYIINIIGGGLEQMTNNKDVDGFANDASWSPNGRSIVYEQGVRRQATIHIMNVNTKLAKPLIEKKVDILRSHPRWSPDGKYILYHETSLEDVAEDLELNNPLHLLVLLFGMKERLAIIGVDGFEKPNLTIPDDWGVGYRTSWSANSTEFVFSASPRRWGNNNDIYRYKLTTHEIVNLTNQPNDYDGNPNWLNRGLFVSPAGKITTQWGELKR